VSKPVVLIAEELSPATIDALGPDFDVRQIDGTDRPVLLAALADANAVLVRSATQIDAEAIAAAPVLKVVARAGVGLDNVDIKAATTAGVMVVNAPTSNIISAAELTIGHILSLARHIPKANASLAAGQWKRSAYTGTELFEKTVGIVGLGRIGQAVAVRALAMEMKVLGYDPFLSAQRAKDLGIRTMGSPREMLPHVDFLTVHTPLNEQTKGLIGPDEVKLLKKGARLVNCARGGIYDEAALAEGLKSGQLGGVALDVYATEPCTDSPLFGMPNVLCTPHLGASTEEAQSNVAVEAAGLLLDFFTTGAIRQAVNMSPLDPKTLEELRGWLNLTYRLGLLLAQVDHAPPTACKLRYRGEVAKKDTRLLSSAFAAGLVERALESPVNIVNAEVLLRARGIELVEERSSDLTDFSSMITAEVASENRTAIASGTLFGNSMPRLVQKGDCRLESYLDGTLLIFIHRDVPGVIGQVGGIFGKHRVNIAHMSVGRETNKPGGVAIGVLSLDAQPPAEALAEVLAMPTVSKAWIVQLPPPAAMPAWLGNG